MGSCGSKDSGNPSEKDVKVLREKIWLLQGEIKEMMYEREKESRAYERDLMVFAFKEGEWKQERKRLKEEVKRLRKVVEEKEERIIGMVGVGEKSDVKEWELLGRSFLVEQMREEREWRDEAVEKWKRLYLAIKTELDDLIQRTHAGDGLYWRAEEEDMMEELKRELKAKEEIIQTLKDRLAYMEGEEYKREREVDLLRQSLRIMSHKKTTQVAKSLSQSLHKKGIRK